VELLFWLCCAALLWAYFGYPAVMVARAALRRARRPGMAPASVPRVSVILAVRNGAAELPARLANLLAQDYPPDALDVVVVSNGSTDGSVALAKRFAQEHPRVSVLESPPAEGKAGALNLGAAAAAGDVLVFADARQRFDPRAVRRLVRAFRDPAVGGVTGRLVIGESARPVVNGVGRYWQLETQLRLAESRTGSVVGATGAIYAVRRSLFRPLPHAVILDDVYLPLSIVEQGYRIAMAPRAVAYDRPSGDYEAEYRRRVRTLVGNLELLRLKPRLLSPFSNRIFVRYVSHKLLRVLTPALCIAIVVSGLLSGVAMYAAVAGGLVLVYMLGGLGLVLHVPALALPSAFLLLHTAGLTALMRPARSAADVWAP
jgi:cellulose synthase/poly-beta-1,6-N-acetylglucosamine synthase-like glycosyltransferase